MQDMNNNKIFDDYIYYLYDSFRNLSRVTNYQPKKRKAKDKEKANSKDRHYAAMIRKGKKWNCITKRWE